MGFLIPSPIPSRPYKSLSMDFIVDLPWSDGYNAAMVTVDHLTKHVQFIPMTTGQNAKGFGELFGWEVVCCFGLPSSIICDHDPRWTSEFWREVARVLKIEMAYSSSHHPQHDGQTEIIN